MVHDCSITERWMIVYDFPVTFDIDAAMSGTSFRTPGTRPTRLRIGLVPLGGRGSDVRWFEVNPCYVFHPLNSFDDGSAP